MKIFLLFFLSLIVIVQTIFPQSDAWKHYSYEGYKVNYLCADGDFMWIGTDQGIVRVNTVTSENDFFTFSNLHAANIYSISIDKEGNKWFGTNHGLIKFDNSKFEIYNTSNSSIPSDYVICTSVDSKGNIWSGTWDGVAEFNGSDWKVYKPSNSGLPDHDIRSIAVDKKDAVWIGTHEGGLARFDGTNWTIYDSNNSILPDNWISTISIDPAGNKLITPGYGGLIKYNDSTWTTLAIPDSIASIYQINFDEDGNMWLATINGVAKYNGLNFTVYNKSNTQLLNKYISSIAIDNMGFVWVGSNIDPVYGNCLQKFDGTNWKPYNNRNSFSLIDGSGVHAIAVDSSNVKWLASGNSLIKIDNSIWTTYDTSIAIQNKTIYKIIVDRLDNKWMTTTNELIKYDNNNFFNYQLPIISASEWKTVKGIAIDNNNHKWLLILDNVVPYPISFPYGHIDQLYEFNDTTWIKHWEYIYSFGEDQSKYNSVCTDGNGNVWFSAKAGLTKYDGKTFTVFNSQNSGMPDSLINCITNDNKNLWIGTNNGIAKYDNNNWTIFNKYNSGLPSDTVKAIKIDGFGNKWILTDGTLVKYDNYSWKVYNDSNSGIYRGQSLYCLELDKEMNKWIGAYQDLIVYTGDKTPIDTNAVDTKISGHYLSQNYPNPFNRTTTIGYFIPQKSYITINIYDVLGRKLETILNEEKQPGNYKIKFNAESLSSGVYFYQIKADGFIQTKKMILLK